MFRAVLTDEEYTYVNGVSSYTVKVTVGIPTGEGKVLTAITVPVNYAVLTADAGNVSIRNEEGVTTDKYIGVNFYKELDVVVYNNGIRTETKITDVKWQNKVIKTDANGTYHEFKIVSFAEQNEITVDDSIIESAKITAYILTSGSYTTTGKYARGVGDVIIPVVVSLSGYEAYSSGWLGYDGMVINDATGLVNVNSNLGFSSNVVYVGGNNANAVTGNPSVTIDEGATVNAVYGGGFKGKVTGNATITLREYASVNNNVYAGSLQSDFVGDTTINIESGASVKGKVYACSDAGHFRGDVTINIEKGAKVGGVTIGNNEENYPSSVSLYVTSGFDFELIEGLDTGIIKLYVDGERVYHVTEVYIPETAVFNVALGTDINNIALPTTLPAKVNNVTSVIENVTWISDDYNPEIAGKYTFRPVVPENYTLTCDISNITVAVRVLTENAGQAEITAFESISPISVSYGTSREKLNLPATVSATVNGQRVDVEVDQWACADYNGLVHDAEYTFTAVVSAEYNTDNVTAPTVVVRITKTNIVEIYLPVTKTVFPLGAVENPVFYDMLSVKLYEGHFIEDRETFVTDREIKVVRRAGLIRTDYYVDYGTTLENIGLPNSFEGEIDGKTVTVEGISYEPVNGYSGNVAGRYEFKLNVPDGYIIPITTRKNAETITVVVSDNNQGGNITEILAENTGYTLANGTAAENVGLPSAYSVMIAGQIKKTAPVKAWNVTDENGKSVTYDRYKAGTYVFTPDFGSAYTVDSNVVVPTHTVKLSALRPYTNIYSNNTYSVALCGIPAEHKSEDGIQYAYDKAGNFLAMTSTGMYLYAGAVNKSYSGSWYVDDD